MALKDVSSVVVLILWIGDLLFALALFPFVPESIDFPSGDTYFVIARVHMVFLIWFLGAIPLSILTALWIRARSK